MEINNVFINYVISNSLCTLFVVLFWYQNRSRFDGLDFWLAGFTMQITGVALLVLHGVVPNLLSHEFFNSDTFDVLIILLHQMLFALGTFGLFMMVNQRLIADLERDADERRQMDAALRLSEEKFFKAFHASPDAIFISRVHDDKLVEVNDGFCRLTGYTSREALSSSSIDLNIWEKPQDREALITALEKDHGIRDCEFNFRKKSGEILNCLFSGEILRLGGEIHIMLVIHDITERIQRDASLRQAQSQVVEQQRALAVFEEREHMARDLHDGIGQTIGYINVQAQAVRDLLKKDEKESAIQLLTRLVEVAQGAHGDVRGYILGLKSDSASTRQDFLVALTQYCEHLRQTYEFHVTLRLPEDLPIVLATTAVETQLIYILREALSNAQRHSGVSQAGVTITLDDTRVYFIVQDMGVGIAAGYEGPERRAGVHFGLEMMKERAEQVGGSLQITASQGSGMEVSGWLPRKLPSEDLPSARILLVDDHPLFLSGLSDLLTARGMQVLGTASNGFEALEAARKIKPDIIAMDIQMPYCNGLEATRMIKAEMPNVKIVMLTTSAGEEHLFEALQNGASGYLLKSMGIDEFLDLLSGLIRGESIFSPGLAARTLETFTSQKTDRELGAAKKTAYHPLIDLTERQLDVLRLVSQGLLYKEIGSRLFLTERTVKYHIGEILGRLHLKSRREAIKYAKDKGLV